MFRLTTILALCLFAFTACQDTASTSTDEETTVDTTPNPVAPVASDTEVTGENFVIKTIDGEIKSPRKELEGQIANVPVTINYGSPAVNDRTIYGDLVPYEKVWRTGANEATRITFKEPVLVGKEGKKLAAGTYALFTRPNSKTDWTVMFNKKADQWGAYDYDEKDDVVVIKGMSQELGSSAERMDFALDGDNIKLMWADLAVMFPVQKAAK
ncbi:DUF2911 domain-containing protein [Lewinella sp. 4G2]|uniref:DUF2911 domain-containing protein n=1 Tax=Lewinella sp. 4G2 TaxID=1803372 RepID=UPI0007B4AF4A|nr:DUF2911 domain-containing protein [Lewinella sp. 4G2]OAV45308.1 hypothetical protein A3850_012740 [Lewinella sp. 4G2]